MAYSVHNFEQGDVLYASQLNEMDAQIALNEENISNGISSDMLAEEYSANKTYSVGDYVIYNNELYVCIYEIIAPEGWNSAHWQVANLGDGISDAKNAISQLENGKSNVDILTVEDYGFVTGRIVSNTTGVNSSTTNTRYFASLKNNSSQGKIPISGYEKLILTTDTTYTARTTIAFFKTSDDTQLIGTPIYNNPTDAKYEITIPSGAKWVNIGGYGTSNGNAPLGAASTKLYGVTSYFVGKMDTELTSTILPAQGKAVGDRLTAVESALQTKVKLNVPSRYELVVGDTFQLFYNGIILAANSKLYDVVITCSKGNPYDRYFQLTPKASDVGTTTMTIKLYGVNHELIDTKTVDLIIKDKATSPATEKVILYVGDSLTTGGYAPGEFKRRLVAADGTPTGDNLSNITFIGSKSNGYVNYEGQGGRSWRSYIYESPSSDTMWITVASHDKTEADQHSIYADSNGKEWKIETVETNRIMIIRESASGTLPASGTLTWVSGGEHTANIVYSASEPAAGNPFWNSTLNKVDIASYVTAQGANDLNYVYVLLGYNWFGTDESTTKEYVRTFIDNVLESYPSCKVVVLGVEAPSRNGLAQNYGAKNALLARYFDTLEQIFNLNTWYEEVTQEDDYIGKAFFVQVSGQFDTEYNMPTVTRYVNTRNTTTITMQDNGVHPSIPGYYQIADACWRDFMHRLQDV